MVYQSILQNIGKHIKLTAEESDYFTSLLRVLTLKKKTALLREGQLCQHIFFVNAGVLRAFCTDRDGKEATIMFAVSDWWITDMYCFVNQLPAMMNIEALEPSECLCLGKDHLDSLFMQIPKFERVFRVLMQNAYTREQLRSIQSLTLPAEERYFQFLQKYPQIVPHLTQKQIASYLGITPEFLSVIRRKRTRGKLS